MDTDCYKVILTYDTQDIVVHEKLIRRLSRLDPTAADRLGGIISKGRIVLKKNADLAAAQRIKRLLSDTGAVCYIEKQPPSSGPANGQAGAPAVPACPNCGHCQPQPPETECPACGIIFSKAGRRQPAVKTAPSPVGREQRRPAPLSQRLAGIQRHLAPVKTILEKIQKPLGAQKVSRWTQRVADAMLRCALVFFIALILQFALLSLGKVLWALYSATPMGVYYIEKMPEQSEIYLRVTNADPFALAWTSTLAALYVCLGLGGAAQLLHLVRYLYVPFGIIGRMVLWYLPFTGLAGWVIGRRDPYPDYFTACTLAIVPTVCLLSSCLHLAQGLLPRIGELGKDLWTFCARRDKIWRQILNKVQSWIDKG